MPNGTDVYIRVHIAGRDVGVAKVWWVRQRQVGADVGQLHHNDLVRELEAVVGNRYIAIAMSNGWLWVPIFPC